MVVVAAVVLLLMFHCNSMLKGAIEQRLAG